MPKKKRGSTLVSEVCTVSYSLSPSAMFAEFEAALRRRIDAGESVSESDDEGDRGTDVRPQAENVQVNGRCVEVSRWRSHIEVDGAMGWPVTPDDELAAHKLNGGIAIFARDPSTAQWMRIGFLPSNVRSPPLSVTALRSDPYKIPVELESRHSGKLWSNGTHFT